MKPACLSLLLFLPLASCSTTATKPAEAPVAKTEEHAKKGRHSRHAKKEAAAATAAATTLPVKPYPLKTCLVTGDKITADDEQISTVYKGQEYKLCCRKCLAKFKKEPEKYAALLNK